MMQRMDTEREAQWLLSRIQCYWAERGHEVSGYVARGEYSPRLRSTVFEVRTNLIDGVPASLAHRRQAAA